MSHQLNQVKARYPVGRVLYYVGKKDGLIIVGNPDTHHKLRNGKPEGIYLFSELYSKRKKLLEFTQSEVEHSGKFKEHANI